MAEYQSKYTGEQIDNAVGKALEPNWNDLTDKPFYEEPAVMGKVFECTIPAGENGLYFDAPEGFSFVEGVPVTINGTTLEADYAYAGEGVSFACGDYLSITGTHYRDNIIDGQMCVTAYDPNGQGIDVDRHITIDVDVVVKEAVVHPIEPKYIPGAVLPVVEFSTYFSTKGSRNQPVTAEENAQLNAMASAMTPFIAKIDYEEGHMICVLDFARHSNYQEFFHYHEQNPVRFIQSGENDWRFVGIEAP